MNGSIDLESTLDHGSKATFIVPLKVSSWCRNPRLESSSSSPNLGFHSRAATWTQPLAQRSINQDLLNQQISASVTTSFPSLAQASSSRHASLDITSNLSSRHPSMDSAFNFQIGSLTPEQRSKVHVLVVEDKYVPTASPLPFHVSYANRSP